MINHIWRTKTLLSKSFHRLKLKVWQPLAPNVQGAVWVALSGIFFSLMAVGISAVGQRLASAEIVFFRTLFQFIFILPLLVRGGVAGLRTNRLRLHLLRACMAAFTVQCTFYALTRLPLADVTAISFSRSLFLTVLAVIFLKELVGAHRWSATIIGFIGVVIILQPGSAQVVPAAGNLTAIEPGLNVAALIAVFGACLSAGMTIIIRMLSSTEANAQIMLFPTAINLLVSAPLAFIFWQTPNSIEIAIIAAAAVAGFVGQWCIIEGFRVGEASALAPVSYLRILYASALGFVFFAQVPTVSTVIGSTIIVAATLYTMHRESVNRHQRNSDTDATR